MNTIEFQCVNVGCSNLIQALPSQAGMKIECPQCDQLLIVPGGVPKGQQVVQDGDSSVLEDAVKTIFDEEIKSAKVAGEFLLGSKQSESDNTHSQPSILDRLYIKLGDLTDRLVGEVEPDNGFRSFIYNLRKNFKELSDNRKRHVTFFISLGLVYILFLIFTFKFSVSIAATLFWAAFVALNQVSFLDKAFRFGTKIFVYTTIFFLPDSLQTHLATIFKYIFNFIVIIFLGIYIGPIYILYKIVLLIIDKEEL